MTTIEYERKLSIIQTSSATNEVKEEAIIKLNNQFNGTIKVDNKVLAIVSDSDDTIEDYR